MSTDKRRYLVTIENKMLVERTQATMTAYLRDLLNGGPYEQHLAEDVVVTVMWSDQMARGRDAAKQMVDYLHQQAFEAKPVLRGMLAGEGQALAEADFVAKHTGEFAGIAATGREVTMPYCVVYDLA